MITKISPDKLFLLVFTMVLFLLLTGCTNYVYRKLNVTQEQANKDMLYCDQYVMQSIIAKGYQGNSAGMAMEEVFAKDRCLSSLGYYKVEVR